MRLKYTLVLLFLLFLPLFAEVDLSLGLGASYMRPVGEFSDYAEQSLGNSLEVRVADLLGPIELRF